jgi:hypothetical protein
MSYPRSNKTSYCFLFLSHAVSFYVTLFFFNPVLPFSSLTPKVCQHPPPPPRPDLPSLALPFSIFPSQQSFPFFFSPLFIFIFLLSLSKLYSPSLFPSSSLSLFLSQYDFPSTACFLPSLSWFLQSVISFPRLLPTFSLPLHVFSHCLSTPFYCLIPY